MTAALSARSQAKRDAILDAARTSFLANGYQGTSVDQIAAAATVSKQTVYKHFGDKRELLSAIVHAVLDGAVRPFAGRVAHLSESTDLRADLTALGIDYLRSVLSEPVVGLRRLVVAEAGRVPELAELYYRQAPARTLAAFADAFAALDRRGVLAVPDAALAAEHFAFLVVGRSIDQALFFGGPRTLAELDLETYVGAGVRVFLAAYEDEARAV